MIAEGSAPVMSCAVEPLMEDSSPDPEPEVGLVLDSSIFICGRGGGDRFVEGSLLMDTLLGLVDTFLESGKERLIFSGTEGDTSARASPSR